MRRVDLNFSSPAVAAETFSVATHHDVSGEMLALRRLDQKLNRAMEDWALVSAVENIALPDVAALPALVMTLETVALRLGLSQPSLESHYSPAMALEASLYSIGEAMKNAFKKIVEVIRALWKKLVAFIKRVFDTNASMRKEAVALKAKLSKGDYVTVAEGHENDKFENAALAEKFVSDQRIDANVVLKMFELHDKFAEKSDRLPAAIAMTALMLNVTLKLNNPANIDQDIEKAYQHTEAAARSLLEFMLPDKTGQIDLKANGGQEKETELYYPSKDLALCGGKQFAYTVQVQTPVTDNADSEIAFSIQFTLRKHEEKSGDSTELTILTKDEMIKLCDAIIKMTQSNDALCRDVEKANKEVASLVSVMERMAADGYKNDQSSDKEDTAKKIRRAMLYQRRVVSTIGAKTGAFSGTVTGLNVKLCQAAAKYVKECMARYK